VLAAVKRLAGVELNVKMGPRRAGDPAMLVARADRIRRELAWHPQYDDLETIVRHSLEWERKLPKKTLAA
jgi:UDP-glucose 4-epimerase